MTTIYKGQALGGEFEWVTGRIVAERRPNYTVLETGGKDQRTVYTASLIKIGDDGAQAEATPRGKILREAEGLITGDRNKNYGSPTENFDTTAALWNAQLGHKLKPGESFTATDVALLMVQLKMARLKTSTSNRDHYLDIAGYIACGYECQEVEDASA
jgi:hypothetical protein